MTAVSGYIWSFISEREIYYIYHFVAEFDPMHWKIGGCPKKIDPKHQKLHHKPCGKVFFDITHIVVELERYSRNVVELAFFSSSKSQSGVGSFFSSTSHIIVIRYNNTLFYHALIYHALVKIITKFWYGNLK